MNIVVSHDGIDQRFLNILKVQYRWKEKELLFTVYDLARKKISDHYLHNVENFAVEV